MFAFLKRQNYDVTPLFEGALAASRQPVLYRELGVPDTFDGRFDALLLHLWPVFRALQDDPRYDRAAQRLYDLTFRRMELALRETGTGDLGVGKQIRVMMKAFYGRLSTYNACATYDQWQTALARNLYGTVAQPQVPARMVTYAQALAAMPAPFGPDDLDLSNANLKYPHA